MNNKQSERIHVYAQEMRQLDKQKSTLNKKEYQLQRNLILSNAYKEYRKYAEKTPCKKNHK